MEDYVVKKKRSKAPSADSARPEPGPATRHLSSETRLLVVISVLLVVVTIAAYSTLADCEFIANFDDAVYVTKNPFIMQGFNAGSVTWAFTTFRATNWHPVTWLSHMADFQLYGLDPRGHHLTNLLFHLANALLLFFLLKRMTGAVWRSGFVAALFALHPLHVESVAWVAERKDVLSTFFCLITMYAYVLYARRPRIAPYMAVVVAYALGLMAKPMLVTLPFVLLLLDYWPLDRMKLRWRLVWEKLPLMAMAIASSVVTVIAQGSGGAVQGLDQLPLGYRIGNACVSYVEYLYKMIWPARLAVFYPHPQQNLPIWQAIGAGVVLAVVTILAVRARSKRPYLTVGWLWYLITLAPVIGLMQVGMQGMADRYTYMAITGLFVIIAWGVPDLLASRGRVWRGLLPGAAGALVVVLAVCTWFQVGTWTDSDTLFNHAAEVVANNAVAYERIGLTREDEGDYGEAISDYTKAITLDPRFPQARMALGRALIGAGRPNEGLDHLRSALRMGLDYAVEHHNLAIGYYNIGKLDLAAQQCIIALRLDPTYALSENLLGVILGQRGQNDRAISLLQSAVRHDPFLPDPHQNLALVYLSQGDCAAAWREVQLYRAAGREPDPQLLQALAAQMQEPR